MALPERRQNARVKLHFFVVIQKKLKSKRLSQPHIGFTRDISINGLYFYTRMRIVNGENLSLCIYFVSDGSSGVVSPKLEGIAYTLRIEQIYRNLPLPYLNGVAAQFLQGLVVTF
jgi:hypothetical protein